MKKLFILCILARLILAYIPSILDKTWLTIYGYLLLAISLGFIYLYFSKKRLNAPEAGGVTWWSNYRLLIGLLYFASAMYCLQGNAQLASVPILIDVVLGIILTQFKD